MSVRGAKRATIVAEATTPRLDMRYVPRISKTMTLTRYENQTFSGQTLEVAGGSFLRCKFVDCTLTVGEGACEITQCQFVRCNWRVDRVIRWVDPGAQKQLADVLDLLRISVGKPTLASEFFTRADLRINPYATHLPMLMACVAATEGPVLEMGCGNYSTPILSEMCRGRRLITVDDDPAWMPKFTDLAHANHQLIAVKNWTELVLPDLAWDVVLIDHAPAEQRRVDIERFMDKASLIVVHDTETPDFYGYNSILPRFRYRHDHKRWTPWTTVVSQTTPLDFLVAR